MSSPHPGAKTERADLCPPPRAGGRESTGQGQGMCGTLPLEVLGHPGQGGGVINRGMSRLITPPLSLLV